MKLAREGIIRPGDFNIFAYGGTIRNLTTGKFEEWIRFLLSKGDSDSVRAAAGLFNSYYVVGNAAPTIPGPLALEILSQDAWFQPSESTFLTASVEHCWTSVAAALVLNYPHLSLRLADKMLVSLGVHGTVMAGFRPESRSILDMLIRDFPKEVWEIVVQHLGPPIDSLAFHLNRWLRGDDHNLNQSQGGMCIWLRLAKSLGVLQ